MSNRKRLAAIVSVLVLGSALWARPTTTLVARANATRAAVAALPERLTDAEFWTLVSDISEPGGYFRIADNYTSNEQEIARVFSALRESRVAGGVYLGVGPEQNFSYIAAIRPAMAFVVDIRRQAVMQHLMFKAIFEVARDRADFISLLFSKPRPAGLDAATPIQQIWNAFSGVATDPAATTRNAARIMELLTIIHKFALTAEEKDSLLGVLDAFVFYGPAISTRGSGGGGGGGRGFGGSGGTFAELTGWSVDDAGATQSFLSSEENFLTVKALQDKNLVVPVSGDFGGPKAVRAIGAYLHKQGGVVSAYYVSNVEQYLFQDSKARAFYDNVATLPLSSTSVFIRPYALRSFGSASSSLCPIEGFIKAAVAGRVYGNNDAVACAR